MPSWSRQTLLNHQVRNNVHTCSFRYSVIPVSEAFVNIFSNSETSLTQRPSGGQFTSTTGLRSTGQRSQTTLQLSSPRCPVSDSRLYKSLAKYQKRLDSGIQHQHTIHQTCSSLRSACLQHDSCERCLSSNQTSGCSWCHVLQRWVRQSDCCSVNIAQDQCLMIMFHPVLFQVFRWHG